MGSQQEPLERLIVVRPSRRRLHMSSAPLWPPPAFYQTNEWPSREERRTRDPLLLHGGGDWGLCTHHRRLSDEARQQLHETIGNLDGAGVADTVPDLQRAAGDGRERLDNGLERDHRVFVAPRHQRWRR